MSSVCSPCSHVVLRISLPYIFQGSTQGWSWANLIPSPHSTSLPVAQIRVHIPSKERDTSPPHTHTPDIPQCLASGFKVPLVQTRRCGTHTKQEICWAEQGGCSSLLGTYLRKWPIHMCSLVSPRKYGCLSWPSKIQEWVRNAQCSCPSLFSKGLALYISLEDTLTLNTRCLKVGRGWPHKIFWVDSHCNTLCSESPV